MFCFSRADHASTNLKKFSSSKLHKFTLFTHSFVGWNLENHHKEGVSISRKIRSLESIFLHNKNWLHVDKTGENFSFNQSHTKSLRFSSGKLFYKSNRKLFSWVCIPWYKHSRRWENSRQLCKRSTSSRVCITVSNSPNPSCLYQAMQTRKTFSIVLITRIFNSEWLSLTNTSKQCNHMVRIQNNEYEVKCVKAVLSKVKRIIKGKLLLKVNEKSFHNTNSS